MALTTSLRRGPLRIPRGGSWSVTVPVLELDDTTPANLTGYTAKAQARDFYTGVLLYAWTTAASNLTVGTGTVTLTVPPATSAVWAWSFGRWGLQLTAPSGAVTPLVEDYVFVEPLTAPDAA